MTTMHQLSKIIAKLMVTITMAGCGAIAQQAPIRCLPLFPEGALIAPDKRWPDHQIDVCWDNLQETTVSDRLLVQETIRSQITARYPVTLRGWGPCTADRNAASAIHIRVADSTPHTMAIGNDLAGVPGGMLLNVTFKKWSPNCSLNETSRQNCIRSIAVHEFLHGLGVEHEHERADTPAACAARTEQHGDGLSGPIAIGTWDSHSATNYCNRSWNNGGVLSAGDVNALQALYPEAAAAHQQHSDQVDAGMCQK